LVKIENSRLVHPIQTKSKKSEKTCAKQLQAFSQIKSFLISYSAVILHVNRFTF
jgi:hypothetical protein